MGIGTPPATDLDALIDRALEDFNDVRAKANALTPAAAALISEAPGLVSDPVLGPGTPSLEALNLDWNHFFKGNFETTGHQKILTFQQALDFNRAKSHVERLRKFGATQDPAVFNLNQTS